MSSEISNAQLEGFLDEALPAGRMAEIEALLRKDETVAGRLASIVARRDSGVHSLGAIWRRHRLSCPTREQLGSYLMSVLNSDHQAYIEFHVNTIGCRYCQANLEDLRAQAQSADATARQTRQSRYFQSSAGYLSHED